MTAADGDALPEFREWSIAAVRLLQGVVYADDAAWDILLTSRSSLAEHFGRLGLLIVVDEPEGFAYLQQLADDELPQGYDRVPKLFRRTRLGYDATLLCVLLREELRRFEEDELRDDRCVAAAADLFEHWKGFYPAATDEVRLRKGLAHALAQLEEMKFVRRLSTEPEEWEVRRILKARVPVSDLEDLRAQLAAAAGRRNRFETTGESDE